GVVPEVVTPAHDLANLIYTGLNGGGRTRARGDAQRSLLVAILLVVGAQRQDDPVVQRISQRGAFLFSDADRLAGNVVPANLLSQRVDGRQQVFHNLCPNHEDPRGDPAV